VYFRTNSFEPSRELYKSLTDLMTKSLGLQKVKALTGGTVAFGMQPISAKVVKAGNDRGGNALGLSHVNQTWYVINSGNWFQKDDEALRKATRDILEPINRHAKAEGVHLPYLFMNDAGWDQDVISAYGRENVARLRKVQIQYDPKEVFQKLVPGGFKLPKALTTLSY
jgi:hypothetical protein